MVDGIGFTTLSWMPSYSSFHMSSLSRAKNPSTPPKMGIASIARTMEIMSKRPQGDDHPGFMDLTGGHFTTKSWVRLGFCPKMADLGATQKEMSSWLARQSPCGTEIHSAWSENCGLMVHGFPCWNHQFLVALRHETPRIWENPRDLRKPCPLLEPQAQSYCWNHRIDSSTSWRLNHQFPIVHG